MRPSCLIAASLAASVLLSPAFANAADVNPKAGIAQSPAAQPPTTAPALSAATSEKAGCGAVLMILGKVADGYPEMFAKQSNGKTVQSMLSAFGFKGKAMLDEAFAEGGALGLTPSQTYEAGVASLLSLAKSEVTGASDPNAAGRQAGVALMKRCTGMGG
jgi:hypothetical protein